MREEEEEEEKSDISAVNRTSTSGRYSVFEKNGRHTFEEVMMSSTEELRTRRMQPEGDVLFTKEREWREREMC